MEDSKQRIYLSLLEEKFNRITEKPNNIEDVYSNNLNTWHFYNSDKKELKKGNEVNFENGILQDPGNIIASKFYDGFTLTELDFIEYELKLLSQIDSEKLDTWTLKKQYDSYTSFLNSRKDVKEIIPVKGKFNENWFFVGLLFATGEMDNLLEQFNRNFTAIAKHLRPTTKNTPKGKEPYKGIRPYISESANDTNLTDKNIFARPNKIEEIQNYCIDNKIEMTDRFKSLKLPI